MKILKRIFTLIAGLLALYSNAIAQSLPSFELNINPSDYLSDVVGAAGQAELLICPNLKVSGVMTQDGPVVTEGKIGGQFQWTVSAGAVDIGHLTTYELKFVKLSDDNWAVQIEWKNILTQGPGQTGIKTPGVLPKTGGTLKPLSSATGGTKPADKPSSVGGTTISGTGSGYYQDIRVPYEYGYQGSDGKYYVIAGYTTITIFIPYPDVDQIAVA